MDVKTTIEIIPIDNIEKRKDKNYHLKCYYAKMAVHNLNQLVIKIVSGELTPDDNCCAVIDGFRWVK